MADPPPGSPQIKQETQETTGVTSSTKAAEFVSLISDDEDAAPASTRSLGSPFLEPAQREDPTPTAAIDLGTSLLSSKPSKPKRAQNDYIREALAATLQKARLKTAQQMKKKPVPRAATPLASNSEMFVTESHPGTPDAAEVFRALKQDVEEKRRRGVLGTIEEIEFMRAEADEKMRLYKKGLDENYEVSADEEASTAVSPGSFDLPELEEGDQQEEPKTKGRKAAKRKADGGAKLQPKRRRVASEDDTEDILDVARRRQAAKVKSRATKGTGDARATTKANGKKTPVKRGSKKKYTGPEMLNAGSLLHGTNIFDSAVRNSDLPDQPTYGPTSRKAIALKQMIASMPQDSQKIASTDAKVLDKALKSFTGQGSCHSAPDGNWELRGLKSSLKHYQVLGVAFMRTRENSLTEPRGGILGDEMVNLFCTNEV